MFQNIIENLQQITQSFKIFQKVLKISRILYNHPQGSRIFQNDAECYGIFQKIEKCFSKFQHVLKCSRKCFKMLWNFLDGCLKIFQNVPEHCIIFHKVRKWCKYIQNVTNPPEDSRMVQNHQGGSRMYEKYSRIFPNVMKSSRKNDREYSKIYQHVIESFRRYENFQNFK